MRLDRRWILASVTSLATVIPGCTPSQKLSPQSARDSGGNPSSQSTEVAESTSWWRMTPQAKRSQTDGTAVAKAPPPSTASSDVAMASATSPGPIASAWNRATSSLGMSTSTPPQPPATGNPSADPTRLANQPGFVGPEVYVKAAALYETQGNMDAAWQQYQKALEVAPKDAETLLSVAMFHDRQGRFQQAVEGYRAAIFAAPQNARMRNNMGLCLARNGYRDEAHTLLAQAVTLEPENKLYRNNLATLLIEMNRIDEAVQQFSAAHGAAAAQYNVSCLLKQRGQNDLAATYLRRALEIDPNFGPALQSLRDVQQVAQRNIPPVDPTTQEIARAAQSWRDPLGPGGALGAVANQTRDAANATVDSAAATARSAANSANAAIASAGDAASSTARQTRDAATATATAVAGEARANVSAWLPVNPGLAGAATAAETTPVASGTSIPIKLPPID